VKKSKTVAKARAFINQATELKKAGKAKAASSTFWMEAIERGAIPNVAASEFWGGLETSSAGHQRVRDALKQGDIRSAGELINSRLADLTTRPLSVWDIDKVVSKDEGLESPIKRVFYLSTEDPTSLAPVYPKANPAIARGVEMCDGVVYGMGSLYTSIVPSLILEGVGEAIAQKEGPKVLILNGDQDRETGDMSASACVAAVADALNRAYEPNPERRLSRRVSDYVTVVIAPRGGGYAARPRRARGNGRADGRGGGREAEPVGDGRGVRRPGAHTSAARVLPAAGETSLKPRRADVRADGHYRMYRIPYRSYHAFVPSLP
jgi:hypothetical protein